MRLLIFLCLIASSALALKEEEKIEITETIFYAIEEYWQTFGFDNEASRNIFEGALFTAAKALTPAERRTSLAEFYVTRGVANVSRVATATATQLVHMTMGVKGYIFGNNSTVLLKKAFALLFDKNFRIAEERIKENILSCQMINCTTENVENLRYELRNLAAVFTQKVMEQLWRWTDVVQSSDYNMKHFFNTVFDYATDPQTSKEEKILQISEFYEKKISQDFRQKMADQLAIEFVNSFGRLGELGPERLEHVSWSIALLAIDENGLYWQLSEEERYEKLEQILFPLD